jgi:ABC-type transport system substrate-binding protein
LIARIRLGIALLALGLSPPGCSPPSSAAHDARRAAEPARGGTLRLLQEPPGTLDPAEADSVYASLVVNQIFDGLVALDAGLHIVPALAKTWTISRDGLDYTFRLREGVTFQDGTPLSAEDVAYTVRRLLSPARVGSSLASPHLVDIVGAEDYGAGRSADLAGVEALDTATLRIRLERPHPWFLHVLTLDALRVVPRHMIERDGEEEFGRAPLGTGPFRLASWDAMGLRLEAREDYFGGRPRLEGVSIRFPLPEEDDPGRELFLRGELDALEASSDLLPRLVDDPAVRLFRYQELSVHFLGLHASHPPLDDVRVRRAIAHALDRQAIAADAPETRREATGLLPPGLPGYSPEPKALAYAPERARELLADAGYPAGVGLPPIDLITASSTPAAARLAERIRADLAAIGIELRVRRVSWTELSSSVDAGSAPAFLLGWIADLPDADSFLRNLFDTSGPANYFGFADPECAALLAAAPREPSPVVQARLYRDAERRILSLAPIVPLHYTVGVLAVRRGVHGLEPGPMGLCGLDLERVWIEDGVY